MVILINLNQHFINLIKILIYIYISSLLQYISIYRCALDPLLDGGFLGFGEAKIAI